jgi:hypothetical protein
MVRKILVITLFSISVILTTVVSISFSEIRCPKGVCHIVYVPVDNFYYCLGSSVNCCCDY